MKKYILMIVVLGAFMIPFTHVSAKHCNWPGKPSCDEWVKTVVNKVQEHPLDETVALKSKIEELKTQLGILQMKWRSHLRYVFESSLVNL